MNAKQHDRRRFLKKSAALAGLAAGAIPAVRGQTANAGGDLSYGERSRFVTSLRVGDGGDNASFGRSGNVLTPIQDSIGIITPSSLHFNSSHGAYPPDIDPQEYRLMIHGMVDRPLSFTLEELLRLPFVSRILYIECNANRPGPENKTVAESHGKTACSEWTGVPLSLLLKEAGVQSGASWIVAEGAESGKHTKSLPLAKAMHDCLVAYGQNGEPVRPHQGYPMRLVAPGFPGYSHVKWLRRIKVVDQPYLTPSERFHFPQGPKSVITFPSGEQRLPGRGFYMITGLAWSGGGAIRTVEVSTDGGQTWNQAQLHDPVLSIAHTRFSLAWNWDGEEALLQSRCTDEMGQFQPTVAEFGEPKGVTPEGVLRREAGGGHWPFIQPWRVNRDGSVHNAIG